MTAAATTQRLWNHPLWSSYPRIIVSDERYDRCEAQALNAMIGGRSHLRKGEERQENLSEDQLVGMIGSYAAHQHLFGPAGEMLWSLSRWSANRNPHAGDRGYDVPACRLDFKTSLIRDSEIPPSDYHLLVRPAERHPHWTYVLVLVERVSERCMMAYLLGWAREQELPEKVADYGPHKGAYRLEARRLHPLMPMHWEVD